MKKCYKLPVMYDLETMKASVDLLTVKVYNAKTIYKRIIFHNKRALLINAIKILECSN